MIKIADKSFKILDKYAPMEKKYLSANHVTLMTKEIRKVTIIRSKLKNKSLKDKNEHQGMIIENNAIYLPRLFAEQNSNTFPV